MEDAGQRENLLVAIVSISSKVARAPQTPNGWVKKVEIDTGQHGSSRLPTETMIQFIEDHRADHGVAPFCRVLPIAPSMFYDRMAKGANPDLLADRSKRDEELQPEIERIFE